MAGAAVGVASVDEQRRNDVALKGTLHHVKHARVASQPIAHLMYPLMFLIYSS